MSDHRAKLVPKGSDLDRIFGKSEGGNNGINILQPIKDTRGLIFPYTPVITAAGGAANYQDWQFTHSNYRTWSYQNTQTNEITLSAKFTAQTDKEARYMLAAMHFFKSMTKSEYGIKAGNKAGMPPPIFHFSYLGTYQYNNIPVVITSYSHELMDDIDYVPVKFGTNDTDTTWVPTFVTITMVLAIQPNPRTLMTDFKLDDFKTGALVRNRRNNSGFL